MGLQQIKSAHTTVTSSTRSTFLWNTETFSKSLLSMALQWVGTPPWFDMKPATRPQFAWNKVLIGLLNNVWTPLRLHLFLQRSSRLHLTICVIPEPTSKQKLAGWESTLSFSLSSFFTQLLSSLYVCWTNCDIMNAFQERLSKSGLLHLCPQCLSAAVQTLCTRHVSSMVQPLINVQSHHPFYRHPWIRSWTAQTVQSTFSGHIFTTKRVLCY